MSVAFSLELISTKVIKTLIEWIKYVNGMNNGRMWNKLKIKMQN